MYFLFLSYHGFPLRQGKILLQKGFTPSSFRAGAHTGMGISQTIAAISIGEIATPVCGLVRNDGGHLLLLAEGLAVGALVHSRICLVGTHQDALQGAEVCVLAVVCALCNGAFNALVCMAVHSH